MLISRGGVAATRPAHPPPTKYALPDVARQPALAPTATEWLWRLHPDPQDTSRPGAHCHRMTVGELHGDPQETCSPGAHCHRMTQICDPHGTGGNRLLTHFLTRNGEPIWEPKMGTGFTTGICT